MANRMTNHAGVNLAIAVWLAHDDYDYVDKPNYISVTTLIKPLRQIILAQRVPAEDRLVDVLERFDSRVGQALHGDIERVWKEHHASALAKLGVAPGAIRAIRINPETEEPDTIPVHTEVRTERSIGGFTIGGKFDISLEYRLQDFKKTSVYAYMHQKGIGTTWKLQGSIYRWLNPDKVKHDELFIQYLLLDWSRALSKRDPNYPRHPVPHRVVPLMSVQETEQWITNKLALLVQYADAPEADLPECSEEDLWRSDPVYKYYGNADAPPGTRSTKNFDDYAEALRYKAEKGKGRIDRVPGKVKACLYCACWDVCTQKDRLLASGELELDTP